MALSVAELESLITDLEHQYKELSRELSGTVSRDEQDDRSDILSALDYQISRLEEQWMSVRQLRNHVARAHN